MVGAKGKHLGHDMTFDEAISIHLIYLSFMCTI